MAKNTKQVQSCYELVNNAFHGDNRLIFAWFNQKNPNLGGDTPLELIKTNKVKKLHDFLTSKNFEASLK